MEGNDKAPISKQIIYFHAMSIKDRQVGQDTLVVTTLQAAAARPFVLVLLLVIVALISSCGVTVGKYIFSFRLLRLHYTAFKETNCIRVTTTDHPCYQPPVRAGRQSEARIG